MGQLIPEVQIGTLGGTLLWIAAIVVVIVALFTVGLGPVVIMAIVMLAVVFVTYFTISRIVFRLKRGK